MYTTREEMMNVKITQCNSRIPTDAKNNCVITFFFLRGMIMMISILIHILVLPVLWLDTQYF